MSDKIVALPISREQFYARQSEQMNRILDILSPEALTKIVGKALYGWSDDEPNRATGYIARREAETIAAAILDEIKEP